MKLSIILLSIALFISCSTEDKFAVDYETPEYEIVKTERFDHGAARRLEVVAFVDSTNNQQQLYLVSKTIIDKYNEYTDILLIRLLPYTPHDTTNIDYNSYITLSESIFANPGYEQWKMPFIRVDKTINKIDMSWKRSPYYILKEKLNR